jgi:hypothetical protein
MGHSAHPPGGPLKIAVVGFVHRSQSGQFCTDFRSFIGEGLGDVHVERAHA